MQSTVIFSSEREVNPINRNRTTTSIGAVLSFNSAAKAPLLACLASLASRHFPFPSHSSNPSTCSFSHPPHNQDSLSWRFIHIELPPRSCCARRDILIITNAILGRYISLRSTAKNVKPRRRPRRPTHRKPSKSSAGASARPASTSTTYSTIAEL